MKHGAEEVTIYGDSMLVIKQASKKWEVREDRLRLYVDYFMTISLPFVHCEFVHLLQEENQMADALATLASVWESGEPVMVKPLILVKSRTPCYEKVKVMPVQAIEKPWFHNLQ